MIRLAHILVCHSVDPTKAIESIPHQDGALWYVFLHSSNLEVKAAVYRLMAKRNGNVFPYCENRGLSKSWNDGIHLAVEAGANACLLLNDDLYFYEQGYEIFVAEIVAQRKISNNIALVTPLGRETSADNRGGEADKVLPQGFACCAIMAECVDRVGYFDENFAPAYFEDWDYIRRIQRVGMEFCHQQEIVCRHDRSSTCQQMTADEREELEKNHEMNRIYYFQKWGDHHEFATPFNRREYSAAIQFVDKLNPYPLVEYSLVARREQEISRQFISSADFAGGE